MTSENASFTSRFQTMSDVEATDHVFDLIDGVYRTQCLFIVCDLGIPDIVVESKAPISIVEIAGKIGQDVDAELLSRIMRYISSHGVFQEVATEDGVVRFVPTKVTEKLASTHPTSSGPFAYFRSSYMMTLPVINLHRLVKKEVERKNLFKSLFGQEIFQHLKGQEKLSVMLNKCCQMSSAQEEGVASLLAAEVDGGQVLLDIGGGSGELMKMVKEIKTDVRCINFDLPNVIAQVGLVDGVEMVAGDMFKTETIPNADVVVMKKIFHSWDDEQCVDILRSCRQKLPDGGKVICIEVHLDEPGKTGSRSVRGFNIDLTTMAVCGSKERSLREWETLFGRGGYRLSKCLSEEPARNDLKVLVAVKTG